MHFITPKHQARHSSLNDIKPYFIHQCAKSFSLHVISMHQIKMHLTAQLTIEDETVLQQELSGGLNPLSTSYCYICTKRNRWCVSKLNKPFCSEMSKLTRVNVRPEKAVYQYANKYILSCVAYVVQKHTSYEPF